MTKVEATSQASQDVLRERQRQVSAEGYTPEHDDEHRLGEIGLAAQCYHETRRPTIAWPPRHWPWAKNWWKPTSRRRDLVKAHALYQAEIDRLTRRQTDCLAEIERLDLASEDAPR